MRALMHDSAEAYLGDLAGPLKLVPAVAEAWELMEAKVEAAIESALGVEVSKTGHPWLSEIDLRIVLDERRTLMADSGNAWDADHLEPLGVSPAGLPAERAKDIFKDWFRTVEAEIEEENSHG